MDDFFIVRFALDNVRVPEIAEAAQDAFERIIRGRPIVDRTVLTDGRMSERSDELGIRLGNLSAGQDSLRGANAGGEHISRIESQGS